MRPVYISKEPNLSDDHPSIVFWKTVLIGHFKLGWKWQGEGSVSLYDRGQPVAASCGRNPLSPPDNLGLKAALVKASQFQGPRGILSNSVPLLCSGPSHWYLTSCLRPHTSFEVAGVDPQTTDHTREVGPASQAAILSARCDTTTLLGSLCHGALLSHSVPSEN